jgi:hypothetical protein
MAVYDGLADWYDANVMPEGSPRDVLGVRGRMLFGAS